MVGKPLNFGVNTKILYCRYRLCTTNTLLKDKIMNELIPVTNQKEIEKIFLSDGLTAKIEAIKADVLSFVVDVTTAARRSACKAKCTAIVKQRIIIDNAGIDLKAKYKSKVDKIDGVRKLARDTLNDVKDTMRKPLTDWEDVEEARVEAERQAIQFELDYDSAVAENKIYDREREIARKEAEMKAKEEAGLEAEKKIEQAKTDLIEKQKSDERIRVAKLEEEKLAAKKASENIKHRKRVNSETLDDIVKCGIDKEAGIRLISNIVSGKIKHVTINY